MTKQYFYDFAIMMKEDSKILFENQSYHNSVYLGAYVLEAYIKILLIHKNKNYFGHINNGDFLSKLNRIKSLYPEFFENSILEEEHEFYPKNILSVEYDINYRYDVNKWIEEDYCQNVQYEIKTVRRALDLLRIEGILDDCD